MEHYSGGIPGIKTWDFENKCWIEPVTEKTDKLFVFDNARYKGTILHTIMLREKFLSVTKTSSSFRMIEMNEAPEIVYSGKTQIIGDLYSVSERTFNFLDTMYKCPDSHKRVIITLEDGIRAYAYILNIWKTPRYEELIESGDWIDWKKSERQRLIQKKEKLALEEKENKLSNEKWLAQNRKSFPSYRASSDEEERREERRRNLELTFNGEYKPDNKKLMFPIGICPSSVSDKDSIHIFNIPIEDIKTFMLDNGHNVNNSSEIILTECIKQYGCWFVPGA